MWRSFRDKKLSVCIACDGLTINNSSIIQSVTSLFDERNSFCSIRYTFHKLLLNYCATTIIFKILLVRQNLGISRYNSKKIKKFCKQDLEKNVGGKISY